MKLETITLMDPDIRSRALLRVVKATTLDDTTSDNWH